MWRKAGVFVSPCSSNRAWKVLPLGLRGASPFSEAHNSSALESLSKRPPHAAGGTSGKLGCSPSALISLPVFVQFFLLRFSFSFSSLLVSFSSGVSCVLASSSLVFSTFFSSLFSLLSSLLSLLSPLVFLLLSHLLLPLLLSLLFPGLLPRLIDVLACCFLWRAAWFEARSASQNQALFLCQLEHDE